MRCCEYMNRVMRTPTFWFPTWFDTNQAVQPQKMARGLKFRIKKVERLYYLFSENKAVFVFAYAKGWFSHDAARIVFTVKSKDIESRHEKTFLHMRK